MVMSDQGSGGLLLAALGLTRDEGRGDVVLDDLPGDDHLGDVAPRRHVVHHVEEDLLDDRAQAAGAGATLEGRLGDRVDGVVGELELDAVEVEELLVLLDERVARLGEDLDERLAVELVHAGDQRQATDELGDQAELGEVLGTHLSEQVVGLALGGTAHLGGEAQRLLAHPLLDDLLEPGEGTTHDEEDVGGVDLDELLVRVLATALRGHRRGRALQHLEQGLLDALTGDVARDRGVLRLAGHLVDLVDVDDARLGLLDVVVGGLDELEEDVLDVLTDVAGLGEGRGVRDGERDVEHLRQRLREVGLAAAGRADEQDVGLGDVDMVGVLLDRPRLARLDALVVVVDRDGERLLGGVLAAHVVLEELEDLARLGQLVEAQLGGLGELLLDDLVAEVDALVADVDARTGDEFLDLLLRLAAEGALQEVATVSDAGHVVPPAVGAAVGAAGGADRARFVRRYRSDRSSAPITRADRAASHSSFARSALGGHLSGRVVARRYRMSAAPRRSGALRSSACCGADRQFDSEFLRDSRTSSIRPYSLASAADMILSRSMSSLTCSGVRPVWPASVSSSQVRIRSTSLAWISMSDAW